MKQDISPMAAFAQALCDVVAIAYAENQVLRELLEKQGIISQGDFMASLSAFQRERFQAFAQDLTRKTMTKANQILQKQRTPDAAN